jgi:formate dehydrogenase subunit gamma
MTDQTNESISKIVEYHGSKPEMLVQILQAVVQAHGWVSEDTTRQLASELNLSRADVHGVVEYYHDFRTEKPARHIVKICQAEACQAMGSRELTAHANEAINADVTLEPVYCLGNCACAPAVMVDGKTHGRVSAERFDSLLSSLQEVK